MKSKTRKYDGSKRKAQAEARRALILKCTAQVLADSNTDEIRLEDVAQAAGVSVQTILRAFGSKDGLVIATLESVAPDAVDFTSFANIDIEDLDAFVRTVFSAYDKIGDLVIHALAEEHRSPEFQGALDLGRSYHVEWVSQVFAPYIERRPAKDRPVLFRALMAATDIYVWKILCRDEALSFDEAVATVTFTLKSLIQEKEIMTKYLWLSHSSGGNLPPSLGVAHALRKRGHEVVFATKPETIARIEGEGFRGIGFKNAYTQVDKYPDMGPMTRVACSLTSPDIADEIKEIVATEKPDAIMVDAMFPAALDIAPSFGVPTSVFCHTFLWRQLDEWQGIMTKLAELRAAAGFAPLPDMQTLWKAQTQMVLTSVDALDDAPLPGWDHVTHVGPVLDNEAPAQPIDLPWAADDAMPLVLVSYTTTELQDPAKVQTALDGLAELEAHVVVTTSMVIDPAALTIPANAHVVQYADHNAILARAALCVTHGGHGTMMRALKHGVPMVLIPGFPHDQAPNAALVEKLGVGLALPGDADAAKLAPAARRVLGDTSFKSSAEEQAKVIRNLDGASSAADLMESIVAGKAVEAIA